MPNLLEALKSVHQAYLYEGLKRLFTPIVREQLVEAEVTGLEHFPAEGPVLVIANHRTLTDPALLAQYLPRRVHFVAAGFFGFVPVVGTLLRATDNIILPVAGGSRSAALVREARRLLEAGEVVVIFPEGVDNFVNGTPEGTISPFHSSFARLVMDLGMPDLPVVPVGIQGIVEHAFVEMPAQVMRAIDPGNTAWIDGIVRGTVHVGEAAMAIGEPLTFADEIRQAGGDRAESIRRITERVEACVRALANGLPVQAMARTRGLLPHRNDARVREVAARAKRVGSNAPAARALTGELRPVDGNDSSGRAA